MPENLSEPSAAVLRDLATTMERGGVRSIELSDGATGLKMRVATSVRLAPPPAPVNVPAPKSSLPEPVQLRSPGIGILEIAHPGRGEVLMAAGLQVRTGQLIGLLRIGAVYRPIRSTCDGRLATVLVAAGDRLGYGQPMAEVIPPSTKPDGA